jgi:1,4-alpha-glucan branching enzyme
MKVKLTFLILLVATCTNAQLLSWTPQFANDNSTIVVTVDATKGNQGLMGYSGTVYMHLGVITNLSTSTTDWKHVTTTWGSTSAPTAISLGNNKWLYQITNPRSYFSVPQGETIYRIALLFRDDAGTKVQKNTDGSDMYIPVYPAGYNGIQFTQPFLVPSYNLSNESITAGVGQNFPVSAVASSNTGTLNLYFNGNKVAGPLTNTTTISANVAAADIGSQQIISEFINSGISYYDTLEYYIAPPTVIAPLPQGVKEGINYGANCNSVTLVLFAPNKTNAVVIGDFTGSNWSLKPNFQMNKTADGNYYWITINGLTPGVEYGFEYVVDNQIYIADPYSEKILDPNNDQYIPSSTYPGLKPYPSNSNVTAGKNGIISVLQTCQPAYPWKVNNFARPDKRNLVTYELLLRDFGDAKNYQMLIDTISYFKRLGINAIELMPVNEFAGNESWGYNPTFYVALDKAYGTKNKFKEFIDLCHQNGIAVILDVVYNHLDAFNGPQGKLYWNSSTGKPAANSPWFNQTAPHPYSVYEDLNHTSTATQYLVERSMEYWLSEYKVDGFRLDLAKGFTQTVTNTTTVEDFDASRVANLERYYDYIVPKFPGTYMILEFLGQQRAEEQEYANHGFLLWGNNNVTYNQATMGYTSNSDFSKIVYNSSQEAFTTPAEMGYMESHDEERLMVRNLLYGNNANGYNVTTLSTALQRQAAAAAVFFTVPGPKMIWQFGERGYDISINYGGRLGNKPPHWEYMQDPDRLKLFDVYSKLIKLRLSNPTVFNNTSFNYDFYDNGGLVKKFQIADPNSAGIKVTAVANFDVTAQNRSISFQSTGNWFNYVSNGTGAGVNGAAGTDFVLGNTVQNITLQPGEYHVYITRSIYTFIGTGNWNISSNWSGNAVPPAVLPFGSEIIIAPASSDPCILNVPQTISAGAKLSVQPGKKFVIQGNLNMN